MSNRAALLIGKITHARKEWESLSSLLQLKVRFVAIQDASLRLTHATGVWNWLKTGLHL
jgi:hypothetical protein